MIAQRRRITQQLYLLGDLIAITTAFFLAWLLRFEAHLVPSLIEPVEQLPDFDKYLLLLPFILVAWPIVFYFHGLYRSRRSRSHIDEIVSTVLAVVLAGLLLSVFTAWYRPPGAMRPDGSYEYFTYSRGFLAIFTGLTLLFIAGFRVGVRQALRRFRREGRNLQRILIVGAGQLGQEIAAKIDSHRELGFEVAGFLDDDPAKVADPPGGAEVLGRTDDLGRVLRADGIDQVFITLPLEAHQKILELMHVAGRECVGLKLVPDVLQYATLKATLDDLDGTPVINLSEVPLQGWSSMAKRLLDLALAGTLSVLGAPILAVIATAIKLEDGGKVFYRQERMGLDGTRFKMLKFRSMREDAESTTGPVWAVHEDPRRTRVGGWLRRWSLDELPQLWNVIRGEMSLVGPRPERPAFVVEFKERIPQYMLRHRVRSGMTGWAQIHGWRGNTSIKKRIQYDLYYVENWSLKLDLKILWLTLRRLHVNAH